MRTIEQPALWALDPAHGNGQVHCHEIQLIVVVQFDGVRDILKVAHLRVLLVQSLVGAGFGFGIFHFALVWHPNQGQLEVRRDSYQQKC